MDDCEVNVKPSGADGSMRLCVLASGSSGNCSALVIEHEGAMCFWLIDAGLTMKRTQRELETVGLGGMTPKGIILTHLDDDHANPSVLNGYGDEVPVFMHKRHLGRASREGRLFRRTELLESGLKLSSACTLEVRLAHHDIDGSATLRFVLETGETCAELGYATDLGRPTAELIEHLAGVDVLAIESNYCPNMQETAPRPRVVKERVTGGSGHLSNQQCIRMVRAIRPRRHVVLLHLSRQCNTPELAAFEHLGADYQLSISSHAQPTGWLEAPLRRKIRERVHAESLFEV